jgi:hypothetical protein
MPTLSQLREWRTDHLAGAADRWNAAAQKWTTAYAEVVDGLPAPADTAWEGTASQAAQARMSRDVTGVQTVAQRAQLAAQVAQRGIQVIDVAKQEALQVVAMANTLGFDVSEDLSVVDRVPVWPPPVGELRARQAQLIVLNLKVGTAQLSALDQQVAMDLNTITSGFDGLDFKQEPVVEPVDTTDNPGFGQCWSEEFNDELGPSMVRSAFTGGIMGAVVGGVGGAFFGGPFGAAGGIVLGFVGGASRGVLITGPLTAAGKSVWDCL